MEIEVLEYIGSRERLIRLCVALELTLLFWGGACIAILVRTQAQPDVVAGEALGLTLVLLAFGNWILGRHDELWITKVRSESQKALRESEQRLDDILARQQNDVANLMSSLTTRLNEIGVALDELTSEQLRAWTESRFGQTDCRLLCDLGRVAQLLETPRFVGGDGFLPRHIWLKNAADSLRRAQLILAPWKNEDGTWRRSPGAS